MAADLAHNGRHHHRTLAKHHTMRRRNAQVMHAQGRSIRVDGTPRACLEKHAGSDGTKSRKAQQHARSTPTSSRAGTHRECRSSKLHSHARQRSRHLVHLRKWAGGRAGNSSRFVPHPGAHMSACRGSTASRECPPPRGRGRLRRAGAKAERARGREKMQTVWHGGRGAGALPRYASTSRK